MFAKAFKLASNYTLPVLVSSRFYDGTVESGIGSFVIINKEGWIVTAAHILQGIQTQQQDFAILNTFKNSLNTNTNQKPNPKWLVNHSLWFGADHHVIKQFHILLENDLAIGKIENFNPSFIKNYPVFKNKHSIEPGTSLCKLGFPFYDVKASFDESKNSFRFDPTIFPIPFFPIDGIMTRNIVSGKSPDGQYEYKWLETSSPGLKGQSGGPTFDKEGKIWAIQSQTRHLPLGFTPKIQNGEKEIVENQFLNVGWGIHVENILKFLDSYNVKYQID